MPDWRIETERLLLRPPAEADISMLLPLIGDFEVARNLSRIPHPYTHADADEFGYWLGKSYWGRGYATEAARALVDFAFDRLDAGRLLTKLGCLPSGVELRDCLARGHAVYCRMGALERTDMART